MILSHHLDHALNDLSLDNPNDIDKYLRELQQSILAATESTVPKCEFKPYRRPYWDEELRYAHSLQKTLRLAWIEKGSPRGMEYQSYSNYKKANDIFRNILRERR
jgi:hypothetical protein